MSLRNSLNEIDPLMSSSSSAQICCSSLGVGFKPIDLKTSPSSSLSISPPATARTVYMREKRRQRAKRRPRGDIDRLQARGEMAKKGDGDGDGERKREMKEE